MLVIIEIRNGVATIITKSTGVEVKVRDFDTDGSEAELQINDEGDAFVEEIYEADEIL